MFRIVANSLALGGRYQALKKAPSVLAVAVRNSGHHPVARLPDLPAEVVKNLPDKAGHAIVISCLGRNKHFYEEPEYDEEFTKKWCSFFDLEDIDSWEIRRGLQELHDYDLVPEPVLIIAALRACRRLNDYALAIRFLESLKHKCGCHVKKIYPWIIQEITPTLEELGIETLEQLGYDKPELFCEDPCDL